MSKQSLHPIEAWNNLSALFKFLLYEEYIKEKTANDIIESLNALIPETAQQSQPIEENDELDELKYKNRPGFVDEKMEVVNKISHELLSYVMESMSENLIIFDNITNSKLVNGFKKILNDNIEMEIK